MNFLKQMGASKLDDKPGEIHLRYQLDTDLSIHLHWHSTTGNRCESLLGLHLARALTAFGMINHSVWIED